MLLLHHLWIKHTRFSFRCRSDIVVEIKVFSGKYKWKFQNAWLNDERFRAWIRKAENDPHAVLCSFYQKSFSVAGEGIKKLECHMKGEKHKRKFSPDPAASKQKTLMFALTSYPTGGTTKEKDKKKKRQPTIAMLSEDKAKIVWSLEVLKNKYPYRSWASKSSLFAEMFKDSKIAQSFKLGKTKCSYVIFYGIAPYFKDLLMSVLEIMAFVVILFDVDEVFNSSIKKDQMDMHVRFWNDSNSQVRTRYLNSEFWGEAPAVVFTKMLMLVVLPGIKKTRSFK